MKKFLFTLLILTIGVPVLKVFVTVGNHDLLLSREMTADYYMKRTRKILGNYHPSSANYIFKKGNLVFIAMNGVKEVIPGPNGYYKESEILWLDRQLTKFKNKKVVILQHFPLLDTNSKSAGLYKKESYFNVLNYHNNREEKINNVYHIVTEKFRDNTYYKIISINDEDGFIYTTLVDKSSICAD